MSGLVEYGDEIDVIAPADILKQIFKMPYSKARLSIVVYRIGQALVLSTGYVLSSLFFAVKISVLLFITGIFIVVLCEFFLFLDVTENVIVIAHFH